MIDKVCEDIDAIAQQILRGKTLLYPTDTIWGIGCDATNDAAVEQIFHIKERAVSKSVVMLMADIAMLEKYVGNISKSIQNYICHTDTPTTFILLNNGNKLSLKTIASDNTIAIRLPNHSFCQKLIQAVKVPLVSTSANISGTIFPTTYREIETPITTRIDLIASPLYDTSKILQPSRIVKFDAEDNAIILRP